jgi:hypothetical protein
MAIDYTRADGQVRLLIADVGAVPVLSDQEIIGYLARWGLLPTDAPTQRSGIARAAADALDAIATSEALISKVIRTQDLQTNGAETAAALRAHAKNLRDRAAADELAEDGTFFDAVEFAPYPPSSGEAAESPVWW